MGAAVAVIIIVIFHLGGEFAMRIGQFAPLSGTIIGGGLTLGCAWYPRGEIEQTEPWISSKERLSWLLIGSGIVMWGLGESFWRYYVFIGQAPFPSVADFGYSSFSPLVFVGFLLQPGSDKRNRRILLLLDSLISTGAILAIAWDLFLGSLAQNPGEASLAKFLGLYYPLADTALLSCAIFLLLRRGSAYQSQARRASLLIMVLGLCCFAISDFLFNIQNNMNLFVEASWIDLGWPLGMVAIGIAAYLRRFLPGRSTSEVSSRRLRAPQLSLSPTLFLPYGLLGILLIVLIFNVLSPNSEQATLRPVLLYATSVVIALVIVRQIITLWDNIRLSQQQAQAIDDLENANQLIAEQASQIAAQKSELENGIGHLTLVLSQIANGNLRARARLGKGVLLPLAGSLNIMAERLMSMGQEYERKRRLAEALRAVLIALEKAQHGALLSISDVYPDIPEINHLLILLRFKESYPAPLPGHSEERRDPTSKL